ncbi:MAG: S9 family peptidase [Bacteroidales bacterium]|jgi:dipeptidyl aminopeptidase/acylaminoacyl peptidase|nr:S9 family peptidase [Bacteroidales bacterium]
MKKTLSLALCLSVLLMACTQKKAPVEVNKYTIDQFYKNQSVYKAGFSFDESKVLVGSNETGIYNVFQVNIANNKTTQLTNSVKESYYAESFFPNDNRFLYSADKGGNEISHIYLQNEDGTSVDLTPGEKAKSSFYGWARDKKSFFYTSNKRDARFFDLYEMNIETMEPTLIYENNDGYGIGSISKDKKYIALTKPITTTTSVMYLHNLQTKETELFEEEIENVSFDPLFFALNNTDFFYTTNKDSDFTYVMKYNLNTKTKVKVLETNWDISYMYNSYNEKYRVIGINQDAKTVLRVVDIASGDDIKLPDFGNKSIKSVSISRSENQMILTVGSSASPSNLYLYNFSTGKLKQLTNTLNPEIKPNDLVEGINVRYRSFDGIKIPALLYKPINASKDNKVPAMLWIHGGPGGQSRLSYSPLIQYLVNHGYAVIAVNNRGSSGYGKKFYSLDDRRHGEDDLMDCVKAKDYLATLDYIDTDKIGIMGGSYGGYMTMAALTYTPEEFKVGVNVFGVTNWLRTLKSIPPYWESFRKALYQEIGDPFSADSVRLRKISPLFHAQNVTKPLMVLQGANDPRVLQVESDEIVEAVKKNGVPVEYVIFPDEGHGFRKKENEIKAYGQVLQFLDKHLKNVK